MPNFFFWSGCFPGGYLKNGTVTVPSNNWESINKNWEALTTDNWEALS